MEPTSKHYTTSIGYKYISKLIIYIGGLVNAVTSLSTCTPCWPDKPTTPNSRRCPPFCYKYMTKGTCSYLLHYASYFYCFHNKVIITAVGSWTCFTYMKGLRRIARCLCVHVCWLTRETPEQQCTCCCWNYDGSSAAAP